MMDAIRCIISVWLIKGGDKLCKDTANNVSIKDTENILRDPEGTKQFCRVMRHFWQKSLKMSVSNIKKF